MTSAAERRLERHSVAGRPLLAMTPRLAALGRDLAPQIFPLQGKAWGARLHEFDVQQRQRSVTVGAILCASDP
ncbi:MAG TPA: hypothetical protein VE338_21275, partial [Ktedonobacterales bacterium]|nr:hypothetical protein [Ktedonobacterales bacterium]